METEKQARGVDRRAAADQTVDQRGSASGVERKITTKLFNTVKTSTKKRCGTGRARTTKPNRRRYHRRDFSSASPVHFSRVLSGEDQGRRISEGPYGRQLPQAQQFSQAKAFPPRRSETTDVSHPAWRHAGLEWQTFDPHFCT